MADMGRPTDYDDFLAGKICEKIIGGESLNKVCKEAWAPSKPTVLKWLILYPKFLTQYETACKFRAESDMEDIVEIADDAANDYGFKDSSDKDGEGAKPVFLAEHVARSKLRIDTRLKRIQMQSPKKYGAFIKNEVTGANGGPVQLSIADQIRAASGG